MRLRFDRDRVAVEIKPGGASAVRASSEYRRGSRLRRLPTAVSSRGLGRSPLKAQTRVRIPLPLYRGPFVYRLGRHPFTVQRGVRFPYGLSWGKEREL